MGLALLLPLTVVPGASVLLAFGAARPPAGFLWRAALAGSLLLAAGALLLAQLSLFSPAGVGALMAAFSLAALLRPARSGARLRALLAARPALPGSPAAAAAVAAVVLAAAVVYARPGEHYAGGWDPGVYLAAGSSVAQRGGLIVRDPLLATLDGGERTTLFPWLDGRGFTYPGFYVHDAAAGTVVPQFQPLYPVLLALAIALGGERAALFVNPALGFAAALLLAAVAWRARGAAFAAAAAALLAFNVVQVWNARFATSEVAAQALLLAGFVFLGDFLGDGDAAAGALGGLAFGLAPAATVTAVLAVPFALAAAVLPGALPAGRSARPFVAGLALALAQTAAWSAIVAPRYLASVAASFPEARRVPAAAALALAALTWLAWQRRHGLAAALGSRAGRLALVGAFLLALAWFAALRPALDPGDAARSLAKLSRYLTPGVLLLFAAGAAAALARAGRRVETALLLGGAAMLFFFLHAPRMHPTYPFTLRRFTPLAVPAIAWAAALVPAALLASRRKAARAAGGALLAAAVALPLHGSREMLRPREYEGLGGFLAGLATDLPAGGVLLCEGRLPAYYLAHAAQRRVLVLDRDTPERSAAVESFASRRLEAGETVTLLTPAERPWSDRLRFEPLFTRTLRTVRLSQELGPQPPATRAVDLAYTAYRVGLAGDAAAGEQFPARVDLGENALGLGAGFPAAVRLEGGGRARWTGAAAELWLPWPPGEPAAIVLRAASGRQRPEPARVRLLLDGSPAGGFDAVPAEMTELVLPAGAAADRPGSRRRLRVESTVWNPREDGVAGYPDGLGLLVDWVEVRPPEGRR